mmetsp:Transcript_7644/g.10000  ORF Transcript_7644/g.10000 Transcript_7644/m.10000 type:complete len:154 (+) Transcript_7644:22-483(+)
MGQQNSKRSWIENEQVVVVGVRPRCFNDCSGRSRGRQRDDFRDDAALNVCPPQLTNRITKLEWQGFVNDIRALDDGIGPNKCLGYLMFVPFLGTHTIMLPGMLCKWLPALVRGMDGIGDDYAQRWQAKGLRVTRVYKREGKNNGVHCIRIELL